MSFTILLTCPTSGLHAVVAQAERPFCVGAIEKKYQFEIRLDDGMQIYTLPWSVEGGARRSGFSLTMASSVGPRSVAPREPRMGCGLPWKLESQSGPLGSRLIEGTVAVDWAAELAGVAFEPDAAPTPIAGAELTNLENKRAMVQEIIILGDRLLSCNLFFI